MPLSFTAIDFETANAKRESVCAVGMTKVRDGQVVDSWYSLIRPAPGFDEFSYFNIRVHGITPDMVRHSPTWDSAWHEVAAFIGDDDLVAHNASFDRSVFTRVCDCHGIGCPPNRWYDTLAAARRHLALPNHKLPTVVRALRLDDFQHHHAGADATQAALIAVRLAQQAGATSLAELWDAPGTYRRR